MFLTHQNGLALTSLISLLGSSCSSIIVSTELQRTQHGWVLQDDSSEQGSAAAAV